MELSFWSAAFVLFFSQIGFSGLNVAQVYAIVDLKQKDIAFQFYKTIFGSFFFITLLLATDKNIAQQISRIYMTVDKYYFVSCAVCLAIFEISLILTLDDLGPNLAAIGIAATGPVAYIINLCLRREMVNVKKVTGSFCTLGGAVLAIYWTWSDVQTDKAKEKEGIVVLVLMVFSMIGYYMLQKSLPGYSVPFLSSFTLFPACLFMLCVCGVQNEMKVDFDNDQMWYCLMYSAFIGQFALYLTTNASNKVLTAPCICLFQGIQPIATPWLDLLRRCYFPDVQFDKCEIPSNGILIAGVLVFLGLALYAWGEHEKLKNATFTLAAEQVVRGDAETGHKPSWSAGGGDPHTYHMPNSINSNDNELLKDNGITGMEQNLLAPPSSHNSLPGGIPHTV